MTVNGPIFGDALAATEKPGNALARNRPLYETSTRSTGAKAPAREPTGHRQVAHAPEPPVKHSRRETGGSSLPTISDNGWSG